MIKLYSLILFLLSAVSGLSQTYDAGEMYKGTNDYVTYHAGNLPLIISVPHGGLLDPSVIPDRSCNGCVTGNDTNTKALGETLKDRLNVITGCEVHVVVNELRRSKLDANRAIVEAADGNDAAELAWAEYHAFMDSAKAEIKRNWGRGLVIDLHGHGHEIQRLELGYRVSASDLRKSDSELNMRDLDDLPILTLINEIGFDLAEILRGDQSLGSLFGQRGYDAVPSASVPSPNDGEPYFRGGYITDRYGSKDGSSIDAIQIECHQDVRFETNPRNDFADSLAVVLLEYLDVHYHMNLKSGACKPTSLRRSSVIEEVSVFPNPVCEVINLSIEENVGEVFIFNNLGQVVHRSSGDKQISVANLSRGIYHLLIESSNTLYRQRISVACD